MGLFLARLIDAGSLVLFEVGHLAQGTIFADGMHSHRTAPIVRTQYETARGIDRIVAGRPPYGLQIDKAQIT